MRNKTACFTGHRDLPMDKIPEIRERTERTVRWLIGQGIKFFGVGGAIGYDTIAAEILMELKMEFPQIKVILVKPFEGFESRWNEAQKAAYARLLPRYDKVVTVSPRGSREAYLARDRHLVDNSSICVAYCTRNSGGTVYTVRYAQSKGLQIYNVATQ